MIIKYIDSVPLFSTIKEAEEYGKSVGLEGYHIHYSNGVKGYMGGLNHNYAAKGISKGVDTFSIFYNGVYIELEHDLDLVLRSRDTAAARLKYIQEYDTPSSLANNRVVNRRRRTSVSSISSMRSISSGSSSGGGGY